MKPDEQWDLYVKLGQVEYVDKRVDMQQDIFLPYLYHLSVGGTHSPLELSADEVEFIYWLLEGTGEKVSLKKELNDNQYFVSKRDMKKIIAAFEADEEFSALLKSRTCVVQPHSMEAHR